MKPTRLLVAALFSLPLLAQAHPGHDGDHELVWDFGHLASHPLATLACFTLLAAVGWTLRRAFHASARARAAAQAPKKP